MDDGTFETATRLGPDIIRVTGSYPGDADDGYIVDLARGLYTLVYLDIYDGSPDPSSRATYSFADPAAEMPAPEPDSTVTLDVIGLDSGGIFTETQTYSFGPAYDLDIGGCSYAAIDVEVVYGDLVNEVEVYTLLTDLSFSVLTAYDDEFGQDAYRPVRIFLP
ncbi:hypothetical protein [Histidinibacterium lentulum]|nr:hypothetical protein [Histidinibacterium lentulum]